MYKYNKNAVLSGSADFLCLVCKDYLHNVPDVDVHITKVAHKKNLTSNPYIEKYRKDYIRKINKSYYCQFCNILVSTATKVDLHVVDLNHITKKRSLLLRRVRDGVSADDEVHLDNKAWNGIIDDTCVLCDEEFEDEDQHTSSFTHLLNLVQNKIEFDVINFLYRKIDHDTFHCLTCNVVFTSNTSIEEHIKDDNHFKCYNKSYELHQLLTAPTEADDNLTISKSENKELGHEGSTNTEESKAKMNNNNQNKEAVINFEENKAVKTNVKDNEKEVINVEENKAKMNTVIESKDIITNIEENEAKKNNVIENKEGVISVNENTSKINNTHVNKDEEIKIEKTVKKSSIKENKEGEINAKKNNAKACDSQINIPKQGAPTKLAETASKKISTPVRKIPKDYDGEICKILGATNYVTVDNGQYYCVLCDWAISNRENHTQTNHHKKILDLHIKRMESIHSDDHNCMKPELEENKNKECTEKKPEKSYAIVCSKNKLAHDNETQPNPSSPSFQKDKPMQNKAQNTNGENDLTGSRPKVATVPQFDAKSEEYAKKNHLSYNRDTNRLNCDICVSVVPTSLRSMKEHVTGGTHKNRVLQLEAKMKKAKPIVKQNLEHFMQDLTQLENEYMKGFAINNTFFIDGSSFCFVNKEQCFVCDRSITDVSGHVTSLEHLKGAFGAPVISSLETEFVREMRQEIYHCGFCNIVVDGWDKVESHLETPQHKKCKESSAWLLRAALPSIIQNQVTGRAGDFMSCMANVICD